MNPDNNSNRNFAGMGQWLQVLPRPNYHLVTEHKVSEVNFEESDGFQEALSVVVQPRTGNAAFTITARKEIILSASAVQTPQILQLSGTGPQEALQAAGVDVLIDLPGVGSNLQDHSFTLSVYSLTRDVWPNPSQITANAAFRANAIAAYKANNARSLNRIRRL